MTTHSDNEKKKSYAREHRKNYKPEGFKFIDLVRFKVQKGGNKNTNNLK